MTRPPKKGAKIGDADEALWERVKDTVFPLKARKGAQPVKKAAPPNPARQKTPAITNTPAAVRPVKPIKKPAQSVPEDLSSHKRIKRGRVETQARIDLHGKNHDQARTDLLIRLERLSADHVRNVLVITGRGERDMGVLRTGLPNWLGEEVFRGLVSGFAPAHTRHGGKGAWYVFLRKR